MHTNNVFSLKDGRHVQAVWSDSFIKVANYNELGREGQGADLPKCKAAIQTGQMQADRAQQQEWKQPS